MAATGNTTSLLKTFLTSIGQVCYGGIKPSIPGHGGSECVAYLSRSLMIADTSLATFMMVVVIIFALKTYTLPKVVPDDGNPLSKRILLVLLSVLFGIEVGYKICSKQMLYILNPCHVVTAVQVITEGSTCTRIFLVCLCLLSILCAVYICNTCHLYT